MAMGKWTCFTDILAHRTFLLTGVLASVRTTYEDSDTTRDTINCKRSPSLPIKVACIAVKFQTKNFGSILQWNLWSLYVKMSLRDLNSFSVFFNQFGRLLLHLFPATFIKRQWPCSSVSRLFFLSFAMNLKQFLFS